MIPEYDVDYNLLREAEERKAGLDAAQTDARAAHDELADRYADKAWSAREARCDADFKC